MTQSQKPTLAQWRALYNAAAQLGKMAPWRWIEEGDIFGVEDPESGRVGFVSIMGMSDEHYGIAVYLGALALYQFWTLPEFDEDIAAPKLLEIEQLTLSFEDRDFLDKDDRAIIKKLGLRFRGRNAWPVFRKITPGYFPWFIDAEDARFLIHVLEQTLIMAQRVKEEPELLAAEEGDITYLIRVPRQTETGLVWEDVWREVTMPDTSIQWRLDEHLLAQARNLPKLPNMVEMEMFPLLNPVADDTGRVFMPYILLTVDRKTGMIVSAGLHQPQPDFWGLLEEMPNILLKAFLRLEGIPQRIYVRTDTLAANLEFLSHFLPIEFLFTRSFRHLEQARKGLQEFME